MTFRTHSVMILAGTALTMLSACNKTLDFDLRGDRTLDTSAAARSASANRPEPDGRGIISYPGYQVAVARRGDTVASVAARVGADPTQLAITTAFRPEMSYARARSWRCPDASPNRWADRSSRAMPTSPRSPAQRSITRKAAMFRPRLWSPSVRAVSNLFATRSNAERPLLPSRGFTTSRSAAWRTGTALAVISPCARGNIC